MSRDISELSAEQRAWRSAGLCRACGADVEPGKAACSEHLAYGRRANKKRRDARAAAGLCVQCGAPANGITLCPKHAAAAQATRDRKARQADVINRNRAAHREKRAAAGLCATWCCPLLATKGDRCQFHGSPKLMLRVRRDRTLRHARRLNAEGLCAQCGWPRDREDRTRCAECRAEDIRHHGEARAENRAAGMCGCGRRPRPDKATCGKCAARNRKTRRKQIAKAKEAGRCSHCRAPAVAGKTKCQGHLERQREDTRRLRRRQAGVVLRAA